MKCDIDKHIDTFKRIFNNKKDKKDNSGILIIHDEDLYHKLKQEDD